MSSTCPTCGDSYDTEAGMKLHHTRTHGESIAGFESECESCGEVFRAQSGSVGRYCSYECKHAGQINRRSFDCEICEDSFEVPKSHAERERSRRFCSDECYFEYRRRNPANTVEHIELTCDGCGEKFEVLPSVADGRRFCSRACMAEYWVGENHPSWKGGYTKYWGTWARQRRRALERDDHQCVECGIPNNEHEDAHGEGLHIHHIVPLRLFDGPDEAHRLDNLETLCKPCHHDKERKLQSKYPSGAAAQSDD